MKLNFVIIGGLCIAVLPFSTYATELSSDNYTVITKGFESTDGAILSSESYSLKVGKNAEGTTEGNTDDEENTGGGVSGSKRNVRVDRLPNFGTLPKIISGTQVENKIFPNAEASFSTRDAVGANTNAGTFESDALSELNTRGKIQNEEKSDRSQIATIIEAWRNGSLKDAFQERGARVFVLLSAIIGLLLLRRTAFGKQNLPF